MSKYTQKQAYNGVKETQKAVQTIGANKSFCVLCCTFQLIPQTNSRMKAKKRRKSKSTFKIGYLLAILVLIPVCYGLHLYSQQTVVNTAMPIEKYDNLELPRGLTDRQQQVIQHTGYTVSYNKEWRIPNWVAYELTREETKGKEKRSDRFTSDPLAEGGMPTNSDYAHSGYDKGHMAPAADMKWNSKVMKESFYFSNVCPQHPELNRRKWKDLEEKTRDWVIADSAIIIICGPVVDKFPRTIGSNRVVVPRQFFKVILSLYGASPKAIGFLFDNARSVSPLKSYAITVDSVEKLTGMDFFAPLPDELEEQLEGSFQPNKWGIE